MTRTCPCSFESRKPIGVGVPAEPWRHTVVASYPSDKIRNECAPQRENHGHEPHREKSRLELEFCFEYSAETK